MGFRGTYVRMSTAHIMFYGAYNYGKLIDQLYAGKDKSHELPQKLHDLILRMHLLVEELCRDMGKPCRDHTGLIYSLHKPLPHLCTSVVHLKY